ncbi:protein mono-ADP-ribosyltransferase PARP11 isoform X2 [Cherax quadricarinatus]|nr:protein mono-ADP-ribosyltransferase PARP11-like isoform X2 [Cherax quadricarinatus]XP_053645009.1 protein mono-ADP-ribosyltransferase PARP11-like isoform X2 [Cherax quadricarinatus]
MSGRGRKNSGRRGLGSCCSLDQNPYNSEGNGTPNRATKPHQKRRQSEGDSSPRSADRQDQTISGQEVTHWSYYHDGNVKIPEICVYSIDKRCMYEKSGCVRLHAKCTSQWQVMHRGNWYNMRNFHSKEIEDAFEDVTKDSVKLTILNPQKVGNSGTGMIKILGTKQWEAVFETMMLKCLTTDGSPNTMMNIRRLSTQSAAISKSGKATLYEWFFQDEQKKWIKYGETNSLGMTHLVSSVKSDEIEQNFCTNPSSPLIFSNSLFTYQLDFAAMKQKNLKTGKEKSVRRRPVKKQSTKPNPVVKKDNLPSAWSVMKDTDIVIQVALDTSCVEYRDIMTRLLATLPSARARTVKRIQNPFLWRAFENKKQELSLKYGVKEELNVQKMFHGTRSEHVNDICKENFDYRLHGTNVGHAYGKGTYFSNSAAFSLKYSPPDSFGYQYLFLAEVIIGEVVQGNASMTRPPKNPVTGELFNTTVDSMSSPKIFVKYDMQEYYPLYIIALTKDKI